MASSERPRYEFFFEPEALFKTDDGLLIAQPDVSRQQYYSIEYVNANEYDEKQRNSSHSHSNSHYHSVGRYGTLNERSSSDTSYPSDTGDDDEKDSDSDCFSDSDSSEELDWKCCVNHIDFLGGGPFDVDPLRRHGIDKESGRSSSDGLDDFLSDVLEETNRKKRKEAMLLTVQRKNKWHLLSAPHSIPIPSNVNRHGFKSSFSGSNQTPLCRRCKHVFVEPKVQRIH